MPQPQAQMSEVSSSRSSDYVLAFTALAGFKHEAAAGTTRKIRVLDTCISLFAYMELLFAPIVMTVLRGWTPLDPRWTPDLKCAPSNPLPYACRTTAHPIGWGGRALRTPPSLS